MMAYMNIVHPKSDTVDFVHFPQARLVSPDRVVKAYNHKNAFVYA